MIIEKNKQNKNQTRNTKHRNIFWMKLAIETLEYYITDKEVEKFKRDLLKLIQKYTTDPKILDLFVD